MKRKLSLSILMVLLAGPLWAETQLPVISYLPVVGEINSGEVSYFSELRVTNRTGEMQLVRVDWLALNGDGSKDGAIVLTLPPFVSQYMRGVAAIAGTQSDRMGAAKFVAVTESGDLDPDAQIEVDAVIVGVRRSDSARLTQSVNGVPFDQMRSDEERGMIFYPVSVGDSRFNVGIVNDSDEPRMFLVEGHRIILPGQGGSFEELILVPPKSLIQRGLDVDGFAPGNYTITVRPADQSDGIWTSYVSSIDPRTKDAVLVRSLPKNGRLSP